MRLAVLLFLIAPLTGVTAAQESFDRTWRGKGSKGVGTRLDARKCDFTFTEQ